MRHGALAMGAPEIEARAAERFLVEASRKAVGVAVRVRGGFRFFCSDEAYRKLDGLTFARVRMLFAAVQNIARGATEAHKRPVRRAPVVS